MGRGRRPRPFPRSHEEIASFFTGPDLGGPGIVPVLFMDRDLKIFKVHTPFTFTVNSLKD